MDDFIRQAKAISDPTRVRVLKLLEKGELCVCDIMEVLSIKQPTASKHLNILKTAGLVESRKEGTWSYYRLSGRIRGYNKDFLRFIKNHLNNNALTAKDRKQLKKSDGSCKT